MNIKLISKAINFAAKQHIMQKRKGKIQTPFINHPIEVYNYLVQNNITNTNILCAAILHDIIEDTKIKEKELLKEFNKDILSLVLDCSDDKNLPKEIRKIKQIEKVDKISHNALYIKLADKISNLNSLIDFPPENWSKNRIIGYIIWSNEVSYRVIDRINLEIINNENFDGLIKEYNNIYNKLIKYFNINLTNKNKILNEYLNNIKNKKSI